MEVHRAQGIGCTGAPRSSEPPPPYRGTSLIRNTPRGASLIRNSVTAVQGCLADKKQHPCNVQGCLADKKHHPGGVSGVDGGRDTRLRLHPSRSRPGFVFIPLVQDFIPLVQDQVSSSSLSSKTSFLSFKTRFCFTHRVYRGPSLIRNSTPLGPCSRTMPRALWCSYGEVLFLISEVPLHGEWFSHTQRVLGKRYRGTSHTRNSAPP